MMGKEIRYPCAMGEMRFKVSSVGDFFEPYTLVVGSMQDLKRWLEEHHRDKAGDPEDVIINFNDMTIQIHDYWMY